MLCSSLPSTGGSQGNSARKMRASSQCGKLDLGRQGFNEALDRLVTIVTAPGCGVEGGGVEQQRGQAQGQPPPVEEALLDDEEHGGGLQQQEAAPPRHTGGEAPG